MLLANKESIICGWNLIKKNSQRHKTKLIPIDSEHFSINKLIYNYPINDIKKIFITASGGPFLNLPIYKFKFIKKKDALKHPKWKMGKKISIDSATLANKVLEVSEALKIFPFNLNFYKIIIHPESLIHAIILLKNQTKIFLYHSPDMKIPISDALNSNYIINNNKKNEKRLLKLDNISFQEVDKKKFPIVNLIDKINYYKSSLIVFNAANEIFVDFFLRNKIDFVEISRYLKLVVKNREYIRLSKMNPNTLEKIFQIDLLSRQLAKNLIIKKNKDV